VVGVRFVTRGDGEKGRLVEGPAHQLHTDREAIGGEPDGDNHGGKAAVRSYRAGIGLLVDADQRSRAGRCRIGDGVEVVFVHERDDGVTEDGPPCDRCAVGIRVRAGRLARAA